MEGPTIETTLKFRSERTERAKLAMNWDKSFPGYSKAEVWSKN